MKCAHTILMLAIIHGAGRMNTVRESALKVDWEGGGGGGVWGDGGWGETDGVTL